MPFGGFEIEREDVLVQLRRILGKLYRAVWALPKPLPVLLDVGMVRSALECNIKSDLKPIFFGAGDKLPEIFERPQLWMNRSMTALFGADGPGTSHIIRLC